MTAVRVWTGNSEFIIFSKAASFALGPFLKSSRVGTELSGLLAQIEFEQRLRPAGITASDQGASATRTDQGGQFNALDLSFRCSFTEIASGGGSAVRFGKWRTKGTDLDRVGVCNEYSRNDRSIRPRRLCHPGLALS
jgi:hypothetical protein